MMAGVFDFEKEYRELYAHKSIPSIIDVPEMLFIYFQLRAKV